MKNYKDIVEQKKYHDWIASDYDKVLGFNQKHKLEIVKKRIQQIFPGKLVDLLDVGCGTGRSANWFKESQLCKRSFGIDLSTGMVACAMDNAVEDVFFCVGVGEKLPFDDNSFDVIIEINTLHHVQNRQQTVNEMYRVVRSPGIVCAIETNAQNPIEIYRATKNWSIEWRTIYNISFMQNRIFSSAGLSSVQTEHMTFFPESTPPRIRNFFEPIFESSVFFRGLSGVIATTGIKT